MVDMRYLYLEVAQGAEAGGDLLQTVVVEVDLTDVWDADKAAVLYRLDLVKSKSYPTKDSKQVSLLVNKKEIRDGQQI